MVPLGSKYKWLMLQQSGQGTLTAATAWAPPASPLPAHFRVTPTQAPQVQQAKSRSIFTSIMNGRPSRSMDACQGDRGGGRWTVVGGRRVERCRPPTT